MIIWRLTCLRVSCGRILRIMRLLIMLRILLIIVWIISLLLVPLRIGICSSRSRCVRCCWAISGRCSLWVLLIICIILWCILASLWILILLLIISCVSWIRGVVSIPLLLCCPIKNTLYLVESKMSSKNWQYLPCGICLRRPSIWCGHFTVAKTIS